MSGCRTVPVVRSGWRRELDIRGGCGCVRGKWLQRSPLWLGSIQGWITSISYCAARGVPLLMHIVAIRLRVQREIGLRVVGVEYVGPGIRIVVRSSR